MKLCSSDKSFFQKPESSLEKCREPKKNFEIILVIFWNRSYFEYTSNSPHIKRNLISVVTNLVYELPHEAPNDLYLNVPEKLQLAPSTVISHQILRILVLLEDVWTLYLPCKTVYFFLFRMNSSTMFISCDTFPNY